MNCRRIRSILSAYIDGELTGYEMLAVRDHISHCRECRDEHYSLKTMKYLLSSMPEKEPNPDWVVYLAQSFERPTPHIGNRWIAQWGRSLDAALAYLSPKASALSGRRLAYAFMVSAVAVFVIVAPFNRPVAQGTARQPANMGPSWPATYASSQQVMSQPLRPVELIPIPVPPPALSQGAPVIMPTAPVIRPIEPSYRGSDVTNVNMRELSPAPSGLNGLGTPWPGPHFAVQPMVGH